MLEQQARVHAGVRARWVSAYTDVDCSRSVQASAFFLVKEALEDGEQMEIEPLMLSACL